MKPAAILLVPAAVTSLTVGCNRNTSRPSDPRDPNVAQVSAGDVEMTAAMAKARSTLDRFIADLQSPKPGQEYFSVKAKLPTSAGSVEHIWVEGLTYEGGIFRGKLANDPVDLPGLKLGDAVSVKRADVSDWMIDGREGMEGGFTVEVLRPEMERRMGAP